MANDAPPARALERASGGGGAFFSSSSFFVVTLSSMIELCSRETFLKAAYRKRKRETERERGRGRGRERGGEEIDR